MIIKEIRAKNILSKSKIFPYTLNAYTGCQHGCAYCYARFMKRTTGHAEPWGKFVDVKINAAELLENEVNKKQPGRVWISGVCDPYQPLEGRYRLTRQCLEILARHNWPVTVQTRSPLALRDIDIFRIFPDIEVGFSIGTADDNVRKLFEPEAPPVSARIKALDELHRAGIRTYAMIAPVLPGAEGLAGLLKGKVDNTVIDRMNYHYADWIYRRHHLEEALTDGYYYRVRQKLAAL